MKFTDCKKELDYLTKAYRPRQNALVPIYGRRQVGKTELIRQLLRNENCVYFVGKKEPPSLAIAKFMKEAARM